MIRNLREIILNRIAEIIKGNDYGIIELFTNQSVVCSENDLGQTVLDLLKKSPSLWEDSIISVRQI